VRHEIVLLSARPTVLKCAAGTITRSTTVCEILLWAARPDNRPRWRSHVRCRDPRRAGPPVQRFANRDCGGRLHRAMRIDVAEISSQLQCMMIATLPSPGSMSGAAVEDGRAQFRVRLVTEFTMAAASCPFLSFARRAAPRRECGESRHHLIAGGQRPSAEPCLQETAAIAPTAEVPRALLIFGSGP